MPINQYTKEELLEICNNLFQDLTKKYSVYVTYALHSDDDYGKTIHCNYIQKTDVDTNTGLKLQLGFNENSFRFLENGGFSADNFVILVNVIENDKVGETYVTKPPKSNEWKIYNVDTENLLDELRDNVFFVSLDDDDGYYNLDHLNYPEAGEDKLSFGDEIFFFGNITTKVEAIIHTTDLPIRLPLNEFNVSTNETWDKGSSVYVSEVGLYDDENNLVAIAKLNNPAEKNSKIARTIIFALDF